MLLSSLLFPLAGATAVLASGSSDDSQKPLEKRPPQCSPFKDTRYECPTCDPEPWCNVRCLQPPHETFTMVHTSYDIFGLVFGFEMPPNLKLCPVGKCIPTDCLCRETVLKRIEAFLMYDDGSRHRDDL